MTFEINGKTYTTEQVTLPNMFEAETEEHTALLVASVLNGETNEQLVFNWNPETDEDFADMINDFSAWEPVLRSYNVEYYNRNNMMWEVIDEIQADFRYTIKNYISDCEGNADESHLALLEYSDDVRLVDVTEK